MTFETCRWLPGHTGSTDSPAPVLSGVYVLGVSEHETTTIIGCGNLGRALVEGLLLSGHPPGLLAVTRRRQEALGDLAQCGVRTGADNQAAVRGSRLVLLAVEPSQVAGVLAELGPALDPTRHVLISCVAGLSLAELAEATPDGLPCLRAMPNTASAIGQAMTCLVAGDAPQQARGLAEELFRRVGRVVLIQEELMAAATVLGACGVAYSLRFIRAASQGGIEIGFDAETARLIAAQTVKGAAALLLERGHHPEREIDRVTTPKGCTIAGLNEMEHRGFSSALIKGITTSHGKITHLSDPEL